MAAAQQHGDDGDDETASNLLPDLVPADMQAVAKNKSAYFEM